MKNSKKTNVMPYLPSQLKIWGCVEKSFQSHQHVKSSRLEGRKVPHSPELVEGSRRFGLSYPRQRVLQKHETTLLRAAFSPGRNNSLESWFFKARRVQAERECHPFGKFKIQNSLVQTF